MSFRVGWLDACRAIAICLVLLSHGRVFLMPVAPWAQKFKFGGFLGVELFFILSGFLIGSIIIKKMDHAQHEGHWVFRFWGRRWLRTLPNYLLFLGLNLFFLYNIRPGPFPNLLSYITFTQSLASPHPDFFGEAWSLVIEELFYLLIPVMLAGFSIVKQSVSKSIIITTIIVTTLSVAARTVVVIEYDPSLNNIRSTALLHLDVLLAGVISALIVNRYSQHIQTIVTVAKFMTPLFFVSALLAAQPDKTLDASGFLRIFFFNITSIGCAASILAFFDTKLPKSIDAITSRVAR